MKIICEITDMDILGTPGRSPAVPRKTARAIVRNNQGLYAVMYAAKFNLYSLPGGGVEDGEDMLTALHREIQEETGCSCDEITELGIVLENRAHCDYTQESHYFVVTTHGHGSSPALTEAEMQNGTHLLWLSFEEMHTRICTPIHDTNQRKFLQARDMAALEAYRATLE